VYLQLGNNLKGWGQTLGTVAVVLFVWVIYSLFALQVSSSSYDMHVSSSSFEYM
jgi:hypothetical protein